MKTGGIARHKVRDHRGHHPWRLMGMLRGWRVDYTNDLAADERGLTLFDEKRVLIRDDLTCEQRRSTICHEAGHILRGPALVGRDMAEEALVERHAARLLLPNVKRIGHALAWNGARYEATARELWVDEMLLNTRLSTLAPKEREYLDEQLATILI